MVLQVERHGRHARASWERMSTLEDAYMAVLYPKAVGKDANYTMFTSGSAEYRDNAGLDTNKDDRISKYEVGAVIRKKYKEGLKLKN